MQYHDAIYWNFEIQDPIIIELINSPTLQRLKWIDQTWYFHPYFPGYSSRFDHSMGVYLLLKKYWAPLEEQIAWLIHDVSHGAFSHCLDYVFQSGDQKQQDHQDNIFESFIKKTDIPSILKKYNIGIEYILDDKNFPLKETNLPDLCADRIDYSLRDASKYKTSDSQNILYILEHLIVKEGKRIFTDFASAKEYTQLFFHLNEVYYSGRESAIMFQTVADCLKYAREKWYLDADDFYTTDTQVLSKITAHITDDAQLNMYWQRMNNKIPYKNDPNDYEFHTFCKSRLVDPLFLDGETIKRVSEVDEEWKNIVLTKSAPKEYFLKFTQ